MIVKDARLAVWRACAWLEFSVNFSRNMDILQVKNEFIQ